MGISAANLQQHPAIGSLHAYAALSKTVPALLQFGSASTLGARKSKGVLRMHKWGIALVASVALSASSHAAIAQIIG
ncbi:MAG: hypothetical protein ACREEN_11905, partial [Stellaceae bacterium]